MKIIKGYINNYHDAVLFIHAIRLKAIPLVTRRLNDEERQNIESGSIFCFVENKDGMRRWTDGRIWSPSKICGEFLIYQEVPKHLSKNSIKKRRTSKDSLLEAELLSKIENFVDKTTLHKKTVTIVFESIHYHIISYYRPIFVNTLFMDMEYFKRLGEAINLFPNLQKDEYLEKNINFDLDFNIKHRLCDFNDKIKVMDDKKRATLEDIACEVLTLLFGGNEDPRFLKVNKM